MADAIMWRLAVHPIQSIGGGLNVLEQCPSYVRKIDTVDVSIPTICRWWDRIRRRLGWYEVEPDQARAMGAELRQLEPGQRWGRHLVISDRARHEARDYCERHGIDIEPERTWHPVRVLRRGSCLMCRCPHHDDDHPSMQLCVRRGWATCHGADCGARCRYDPKRGVSDPLGDPRERGYKRRDRETLPIEVTGVSGCHRSLDLRRGGSWDRRGHDLLAILARARDHTAVGDRLVRLDPCVVERWRDSPFGPQPASVRTTRVTHILIDVDDVDSMGMWDDPLVRVGHQVEQAIQRYRDTSGDVAVIRTSEYGIHVVAKLARPRGPRWRQTAECQRIHEHVEAIVMAVLRECGITGGHIDKAARRNGRFTRLPGPRMRDKHGFVDVWHSRPVYVTGLLSGPRYPAGAE